MSGAPVGALIPAAVDSSRSAQLVGGDSKTLETWGAALAQGRKSARIVARKVTCEECFFKRNMLCALDLPEPCATFRPHAAQLKPPPQLHFVFRHERPRAAWAFPTAQEQAALYA